MIEKIIDTEILIRSFHKKFEKLELLGGQFDFIAPFVRNSCAGTKTDTASLDDVTRIDRWPPQKSVDSHEKLAHIEGLGQIVIGTGIEAARLIIDSSFAG